MKAEYTCENIIEQNFDGQNLTGVKFDRCNVIKCSFKGANLSDCVIDKSNCTECDFTDATFTGATLKLSNFTDSMVAGVNQEDITFVNCSFASAFTSEEEKAAKLAEDERIRQEMEEVEQAEAPEVDD